MSEVFGKKVITSRDFPVLLFDAGGTLLHNQPSIAKFYLDQLKLAGKSFDLIAIDQAMARTIGFFNELAENDAELQLTNSLWSKQFLAEIGIEVPERAKLQHLLQENYYTQVKLVLSQPVMDVCSVLQERGYRLAILSNFERDISELLRMSGILDLFDSVLTGKEVGFAKPHPAAFKATLDDLDVDPDEVIHIGNSYAADVIGARRAQMKSVLYDPDFREIRQLAPEDTSDKVVSLEKIRHNRRLDGVKLIFKFEELLQFLQ